MLRAIYYYNQLFLTMKRLLTFISSHRYLLCLFALVLIRAEVFAQSEVNFKGSVVGVDGEPLYGVTVICNVNNTPRGVITDQNGQFSISGPDNSELEFSFIGMQTQYIVAVKGKTLHVVMENDNEQIDEVVVVGYGKQKKVSVVGAIAQTDDAVLERTAGVSDLGTALTGNLPGVVTTSSTGMPGEEDPQIVIRGASSWNNSNPLILVDGIERPMSSVDISSVKNISVLKDASATAVYGVKGANGVIIITTKRGQEGRAKINVGFNSTIKSPSYLPSKLDSYDALVARNVAIEHELNVSPGSWNEMTPIDIIDKYRNPANITEAERYPNVDWQDVMFKDYAMAYNANLNISGGTKKLSYFVAGDYQYEGDLFEQWDNGRGYSTEYTYNRINIRTNLDYKLTESTTFSMNVAGSTGIRRTPWSWSGNGWQIAQRWSGAYGTPPDAFMPIYSDGSFGYSDINKNITNPIKSLIASGDLKSATINLNTDFALNQKLDFVTPGLSARGTVSWDNVFVEGGRGLNDEYNSVQEKYIDPDTGIETLAQQFDPTTGFEFNPANNWSPQGGYIQNWTLRRNLYYQAQLNYNRNFDKHTVTGMGVFNRQETSYGSSIPSYREDWAFRATYDYDNRYFVEYNGAYNGSEKFAPQNRFAFFNSGAIGWNIANESFMKSADFVDLLKLRASYGQIGDDSTSGRWLFMSTWSYGGSTAFYNASDTADEIYSPYTWYNESFIGNEDVRWETVTKTNIGLDFSIYNSMVSGSLDFFRDYRDDILVNGDQRAEPIYFGATPPTMNQGIVESSGYELELKFQKSIGKDANVWANMNMTHAENKIIERADPVLLPAYQKQAGYAMGQNRDYISDGFVGTYDEMIGTTAHDVYNQTRLPGDYRILDYNADGIIDVNDEVPFAYTGSPQNTFNVTFGGSYKNWSMFVQFYGVTNVVRDVPLVSFDLGSNNVYSLGEWWSESGAAADVLTPRYQSATSDYSYGTQYTFDASYVRLKNVELSYTFNAIKSIGIKDLKLYLNGNNLWIWSKMPDDRESNFSGGGSIGAYPTMRRFNFGVKFSL